MNPHSGTNDNNNIGKIKVIAAMPMAGIIIVTAALVSGLVSFMGNSYQPAMHKQAILLLLARVVDNFLVLQYRLEEVEAEARIPVLLQQRQQEQQWMVQLPPAWIPLVVL
jgi:hypothetical protein